MPNNPKNNLDLVKNLMTFSPFGAMGEVFIVEAIREYAKKIASQPVPVDDPNQMVAAPYWHAIATDVHQRCESFYNRHSNQE